MTANVLIVSVWLFNSFFSILLTGSEIFKTVRVSLFSRDVSLRILTELAKSSALVFFNYSVNPKLKELTATRITRLNSSLTRTEFPFPLSKFH